MYFCKYGQDYLHDPRAELLLTSTKLEVEVNAAGSFEFKLYSDHPLFDTIRERDTANPVTVYQDDALIFCGDILSIESDFHMGKKVVCRGELGWLNDSLVRPYSTLSEECDNVAPSSVDGFFEWLIENHNSQVEATKRFKVGKNEGSLLDANNYIYRSDSGYPSTGAVIKEKMLEALGGYVQVRHEDGYRYIDLLTDFPKVNTQIIDFGVNLLDYVKTDTTDDMATFIIPVGKEIEEENTDTQKVKKRLTVSSLGDGYIGGDYFKSGDIIYSDSAVKERGWIGALVEFEDVTEAENLLDKGVIALKGLISPVRTVEVTAIDLAMINPEYEPIFIGQYVRARSKPHSFDSYMLCSKIEFDINQPDNDTFTLGTTFDLLTGVQNKRINALNATINTVYEAANQISAEAKAAAILASQAQTNADEAKEAASSAQYTAEQAQAVADAAQAAAGEAQTKADAAATSAGEATTAANDAKAAADEAAQAAIDAEAKAQAAQAAVDAVETTVTTMQTDVANAQSAAEAAQQAAAQADSKAEEAKEAAQSATNAANAAQTAAEAAQTSANSATDKANEAQTKADEAKTAAADASTTAAAAKLDAEQANKDIAALGEELETVSNTMTADYARKTDLTEATASLQSQITQNAGQISSTVTKLTEVDETANDAAEQAAAAQTAASAAQSTADQATADAEAAQTRADEAAAAASAAQGNADTANAAAAAAQAKADQAAADLATAEANLASVTSRVDSTEEEVAAAQQAVTNAQAAADAAQADATEAATKAANAQTTATNAATAASNAQTAADQAAADAAAAQETADKAQGDATAAKAAADAAAATAAAAQSTADTAKANAATAQSKADQAAATAAAAQTAADEADAKAAQAAADLATAEQNLADVTSRVGATEEEIEAAQAAVETAQAAADQAKADAATAQSTANTAKTNAANAQTAANNAKAAADAAQADADAAKEAADAAQADVDALAVRVTTAETKITQNEEAIELRATKTEVTQTLGGYYTKEEADAAIKVSADNITQSVSETYTTKDEFNALEVGGRNLLYGNGLIQIHSNNPSLYPITCVETEENGITFYRVKRTDSSLYPNTLSIFNTFSKLDFNYDEMVGQRVTLSLKARASRDIQAAFMAYAFYGSTQISFDKEPETITTEWKTYSVTIDDFPQIEDGGGIRWLPYMFSLTDGEFDSFFLDLRDWKFEKGNKATDWTPAPEDMATVKEMNSAIEQKADSITTSVSSTYATKTALADTQADIDNLEIGGRNLATGGGGSYEANGLTIEVNGYDYHIYGTNTNTTSNYGLSHWAARPDILEPGEEYTVSTTEPLPVGLYVAVNSQDANGTSIAAAAGSYLYGDGTRKSLTFTCTADSNGHLHGFFGVLKSCTTVDVMFRVKIEKGNRATDWTPAPEDVDADISEAQNTADSAAEVASGLVGDVEGINESIVSLNTEINQTDEQWRLAVQQTTESIATVDGKVDAVQTTVDSYETWFTMNDDGLTIGKTEDGAELPLKVKLDNDSLDFLDNDTVVAYVSNEKLMINAAEVKGSLDVGGFRWTTRDNGNMGLMWIGG